MDDDTDNLILCHLPVGTLTGTAPGQGSSDVLVTVQHDGVLSYCAETQVGLEPLNSNH
jgi:hypothetical protein